MIWIDCVAATVASDLSAATTVAVDDDCSISLLSNNRDMNS